MEENCSKFEYEVEVSMKCIVYIDADNETQARDRALHAALETRPDTWQTKILSCYPNHD